MVIRNPLLTRLTSRPSPRNPTGIRPLDIKLLVFVAGGYKMRDDGQGCTGPSGRRRI